MASPENWIPEWAITTAEHVLSAVGFLLTGLAGLLYRNYREHRAMLLRHDQTLGDFEQELGLQRSHREQANKGPLGEALIKVIEELRAEDKLLHKRVTRRRVEQKKLSDTLIEMKNDLKWIRKTLNERNDEA